MLLKKSLMLIAIVSCACTGSASSPTSDIARIDTGDTCTKNYPCMPNTPWSVVICDAVCGEGGGYCEPYTPQEEEWCILHPGAVENGRIVCDRWGNPTWETHCLPYVIP